MGTIDGWLYARNKCPTCFGVQSFALPFFSCRYFMSCRYFTLKHVYCGLLMNFE